jgi:hypothetical protein
MRRGAMKVEGDREKGEGGTRGKERRGRRRDDREQGGERREKGEGGGTRREEEGGTYLVRHGSRVTFVLLSQDKVSCQKISLLKMLVDS